MNGNNILADTSLLINFFNGIDGVRNFIEEKNIFISIISEIEVLSYPGLSLADKKLIRSFFNECFIIDLKSEIKEMTIEIRSRYKIKLPDAIIAATGIRFDLPLFTLDKGFKRITELKKLIIEF